jgi:hypothetical protein
MRKILDILGIALPALILLIALFRPSVAKKNAETFLQKRGRIRLANSLITTLAILLLLVGVIRYAFFPSVGNPRHSGPDPVPLAVSKHSPSFNQSIQSVLNAYYGLSESLVIWDTTQADKYAGDLKLALDSLKIEELKVDTTGIYESALDPVANAKSAATTILSDPSIDNKRVAFNSLSENLRLLFIVVKYDAAKLYWQECPTAFGEDRPGNWLSKTDVVRNPYQGLYDPKYKGDRLQCGGPKDTINFMAVDSTRK